jgi:hypothetical protein
MTAWAGRVAALAGMLPLAAAPFSCSSISIDCMCNWGSTGAWMQVGGLTKAPAEAQGSAEDCERWCCTKLDGWKDTPANGAPAGKAGTPGTGRCQTWQYMPTDPTGKENLGCWGGISPSVDMYTKGQFHANEWVGASQCLGIGTDWGTPFLVVLFLGSALYLGGGALYLKKKHGAAGKDLVPHRRKWQHFHGLVLDGFAFARGGGKTKASATSTRPLLAHDSTRARNDEEDGRRSGKTEGKHASGESGKRDSSSGRKSKESKGSKSSGSKSKSNSRDASKGKSKSRTNDQDGANVTEGEGAPDSDRAAASERLLTEQVEQDERLHQSQAKIKVVGLNG